VYVSDVVKAVWPALHKQQLVALRKNGRNRVAVWGDKCIFNSIAVNRNFRTGVHFDKDMPGTYGVMLVCGDNGFGGGELLFPEFDVAVDVRVGDVVIFDSLLWHGNAKLHGTDKHPRMSYVMYATV
jgi:hypothetical protein